MPLYLPEIYEEESSRSMTANFLGLNRNLRIADGEWYDMSNLSGDHAPVMEVRKRRGIPKISDSHKPTSIITRAVGGAGTYHPVWLDGTKLLEGKDGELVEINLSEYGLDANAEHQLVNMGVYLVIHPEMIYVNMIDVSDRGVISDGLSVGGKWTIRVVDYEGAYPDFSRETEPEGTEEDPLENGALWHKTGKSPGLYRYDVSANEWYTVPPYLKISAKTGEGETDLQFKLKSDIRAGDSLHIKIGDKLDQTSLVSRVEDYPDGATSFITVAGILDADYIGTETETAAIERIIPKMDFICEANNRLWGCRYGEDANGNFVNEIYCSARGDFYRWIAGSADDVDAPVTFSVGSDGAWTGAINYDGYPTFFKERIMCKNIDIDKVAKEDDNFKSKLIEWSQKTQYRVDFELVSENTIGTNSPTFRSRVCIEGIEAGTGFGYSKKESQQLAAKEAMHHIRKRTELYKKIVEQHTTNINLSTSDAPHEEPLSSSCSTEVDNEGDTPQNLTQE